jgi:hypothetical protein
MHLEGVIAPDRSVRRGTALSALEADESPTDGLADEVREGVLFGRFHETRTTASRKMP